MEDEVVGHKTMSDGKGGYYHEPLRASEAEELWRKVEEAKAKRAELMPDEEAARIMFWNAWQRLKELGWKEAEYCPKNGSMFEVIEAGSAGIHKCNYDGEWPNGTYWIQSEGDLWPSRPVLFRPLLPNPVLDRNPSHKHLPRGREMSEVDTFWAIEDAKSLRKAAASKGLIVILGEGHGLLHVMNKAADKLEGLAKERDDLLEEVTALRSRGAEDAR